MTLTAAQLNRATLARQLLLKRVHLDPVTAIRKLSALQAQEPASPYLARVDPRRHGVRAYSEERVGSATGCRAPLLAA